MLAAAGVARRRGARRPPRSTAPSGSQLPDVEVPGDFSSAAPFIVAATLLPGSELVIQGVEPQPAPRRAARRARADGRADQRLQPAARRRRAGRRPAGPLRRARPRPRSQPEEVPLLVDELPLFALAAAHARGDSRVTRRRGAARQGDRPDRDGDDGAPRARRRASRRGPTASASAASRRARAAASSTPPATTGSRWSARSPASPRARASSVRGAEAVAVSFPGFYELLDSVTQR